jgi:hypothetical protein
MKALLARPRMKLQNSLDFFAYPIDKIQRMRNKRSARKLGPITAADPLPA